MLTIRITKKYFSFICFASSFFREWWKITSQKIFFCNLKVWEFVQNIQLSKFFSIIFEWWFRNVPFSDQRRKTPKKVSTFKHQKWLPPLNHRFSITRKSNSIFMRWPATTNSPWHGSINRLFRAGRQTDETKQTNHPAKGLILMRSGLISPSSTSRLEPNQSAARPGDVYGVNIILIKPDPGRHRRRRHRRVIINSPRWRWSWPAERSGLVYILLPTTVVGLWLGVGD